VAHGPDPIKSKAAAPWPVTADWKIGTIRASVGPAIPGYVFLDSWQKRKEWLEKKRETYAPTTQGAAFSSDTSYLGMRAGIQADAMVINRYRAAQELATHQLERDDQVGEAYKQYQESYIGTMAKDEAIDLGAKQSRADFEQRLLKARADSFVNLLDEYETVLKEYDTKIAQTARQFQNTPDGHADKNTLEEQLNKLRGERNGKLDDYKALVTAGGGGAGGSISVSPMPDPGKWAVKVGETEYSLCPTCEITTGSGDKKVTISNQGGVTGAAPATVYNASPTPSGDLAASTAASVDKIETSVGDAAKSTVTPKDLELIKFLADQAKPESTPIEKVVNQKSYRDYLDNLILKSQLNSLMNYGGHTLYNIPVNVTVVPMKKTKTPAEVTFAVEFSPGDLAYYSKIIPHGLNVAYQNERQAVKTVLAALKADDDLDEGTYPTNKNRQFAKNGFSNLWVYLRSLNADEETAEIENYPGCAETPPGKFELAAVGATVATMESPQFPKDLCRMLKPVPEMLLRHELHTLRKDFSEPDPPQIIESDAEMGRKWFHRVVEKLKQTLGQVERGLRENGSSINLLKMQIADETSPEDKISELKNELARLEKDSKFYETIKQFCESYREFIEELVSTLAPLTSGKTKLYPLLDSVELDRQGIGHLKILQEKVSGLLAGSLAVVAVDPDETVEEVDDLKQIKRAYDLGAQATALAGDVGLALQLQYISSKLRASAFRKRITTLVGTSSDSGAAGAEFGWIFLPAPQGADKKNNIELAVENRRIAGSATVKVPAWLNRVVIKTRYRWGKNTAMNARSKTVYLDDGRMAEGWDEFNQWVIGLLNEAADRGKPGEGDNPGATCTRLREAYSDFGGRIRSDRFPFTLAGNGLDRVRWVELGHRRTADLYHPSPGIVTGVVAGFAPDECLEAADECRLRLVFDDAICDIGKSVIQVKKRVEAVPAPDGAGTTAIKPSLAGPKEITAGMEYNIIIQGLPVNSQPDYVYIDKQAFKLAEAEVIQVHPGTDQASLQVIKKLSATDTKDLKCGDSDKKRCDIGVSLTATVDGNLALVPIGNLTLIEGK